MAELTFSQGILKARRNYSKNKRIGSIFFEENEFCGIITDDGLSINYHANGENYVIPYCPCCLTKDNSLKIKKYVIDFINCRIPIQKLKVSVSTRNGKPVYKNNIAFYDGLEREKDINKEFLNIIFELYPRNKFYHVIERVKKGDGVFIVKVIDYKTGNVDNLRFGRK